MATPAPSAAHACSAFGFRHPLPKMRTALAMLPPSSSVHSASQSKPYGATQARCRLHRAALHLGQIWRPHPPRGCNNLDSGDNEQAPLRKIKVHTKKVKSLLLIKTGTLQKDS